jgi:hypothetical protein
MQFTRSSPFANEQIPFSISDHDREILRALAGQVAELAVRPIENEKRDLWRRHNALEATRPVIFCDPENGWNEIFPPDSLACEGELARILEFRLRKEVFWGAEMKDDRVIEPFFDMAHVFSTTGWGVDADRIGGQNGGAYTWKPPIQSRADMERLRFPKITVDEAATDRLLESVGEILGDLLTVRLRTKWWWSVGMTWVLAEWRGLSQLMYDMIDEPDLVHDLMAFLRDGTHAVLDDLESRNLLSLNNGGDYVGSGGFGWSDELPQPGFDGQVRTKDLWGFAESQETVAISPRMFEEFVFPYQLPLLERFGLNCYGCCEPLDKRWHVVKQTPRLRRVSASPWADREFFAEQLGDRYIFSMKPHPADVAMENFDEEQIRATLRRDFEVTRDCRVEAILKDTHTIGNDPQRVVRWVQIAKEEAERL